MKNSRRSLMLTRALLALGLIGFTLLLRTTSFSTLPPMPLSTIPETTSPGSVKPTVTPRWAVFPNYVPATPYTVEALYQPFEHGFMVWRSDENCAYALVQAENRQYAIAIMPAEIPIATHGGYGYCLTVAPLTSGEASATPPAGLMLPTGALETVWSYYAEVKARLGYATQLASRYRATIPATNDSPVMDGMTFTIPQMTLPNGHILACGSRSASAGTCDY